jgi:nicotinamide mononucleotide adenylyltransferase
MEHYFIGKFQPPHLGHILTFNKIRSKYKIDLKIMVTQGEGSFIEFAKIKNIFLSALQISETHIESVKGSIEKKTISGLPRDAVFYTGNEKVIKLLRDSNYDAVFVERSMDKFYTGTSIRKNVNLMENQKHTENSDALVYGSEVNLVEEEKIKPIEKVMRSHLEYLRESIVGSQQVLEPLIVDIKSGALLDGSHRYALMRQLGCRLMPVRWVNYESETIFVGSLLYHRFLVDEKKTLNKDVIRNVALSGDLFEPRTTRHFFPFRKTHIPTELSKLGVGEKILKFKHLIWEASYGEENKKNLSYIDELDHERGIINDYLDEQKRVRNYLIEQVAYNDGN